MISQSRFENINRQLSQHELVALIELIELVPADIFTQHVWRQLDLCGTAFSTSTRSRGSYQSLASLTIVGSTPV